MSRDWTDEELLGYLDEMLAVEEMTMIESALRDSEPLRQRLANAAAARDDGLHAVGEIWRRLRLTCPSRSELGSYFLETTTAERFHYINFHLQTVGCRFCLANLADIEAQREAEAEPEVTTRRGKFFQSSAGYLPRRSS
jgi:hypothetical protein